MAIEFPENQAGSEPLPVQETLQPAEPPTPPPAGSTPPALSPQQSIPSGPLSPDEERNWAMLSHLSVVLNLFTGVLGPVAALAIYLVYKDRSRYVAFQSMQALLMQLVLWLGGGLLAVLLWVIAGLLSIVLIGLCLMPVALVVTFIPLAAVVYGIIGAVETNQGRNFRYYWIANWAESIVRNDAKTPVI